MIEFELLDLPKADIKIFLHMPFDYASKLKKNRKFLDQHEIDSNYLLNTEKTYFELIDRYEFKTIECVNNDIRTIEDINEELYQYVKSKLK